MKKLVAKYLKSFFLSKGYKIININSDIVNAIDYNTQKSTNIFYNNLYRIKNYYSDDRIAAYNEIIDLADINNPDCNILDAGCGPGFFTSYLFKNNPNADILGIDFSSQAIDYAKKNYPNVNFKVEDLFQYKTDKIYDYIFLISVLEHLENPENLLINLFKLLTTNGKLVLVVPNGRYDCFEGHIHFWSPESWSLFINKCGLNVKVKHHVITGLGHLCTVLTKL